MMTILVERICSLVNQKKLSYQENIQVVVD